MEELFQPFPKIPRLSRDAVVTEKLDGTNAQVIITEDGRVIAASRKRLITVGDDNFGFASWVKDNEEELLNLGVGRHYGEWWGKGIQRGYSKPDRTFSLFNVNRWWDDEVRPSCCSVVPILMEAPFDEPGLSHKCMKILKEEGSFAAPGYMNPEGIVIYHKQSGNLYKKTFEHDTDGKDFGKGN